MSRLGDLLKAQRIEHGLTPKQLAKLCGVHEKYIQEVELGNRIISDDQVMLYLKKMGASPDTLLPFLAEESAPEPPKPVQPRIQPKAPVRETSTEAWTGALGSMIQRVPILNVKEQNQGYKILACDKNKIMGAPSDQVFYMTCPDDALEMSRIRSGDLLLMLPNTSATGGVQWIEVAGKKALYQVTKINNETVLLQRGREQTIVQPQQVRFIARAALVEFLL